MQAQALGASGSASSWQGAPVMPSQKAIPKARPVIAESASWGTWRPTIRPTTFVAPAKGQGKAAVQPRYPPAHDSPGNIWGHPASAAHPTTSPRIDAPRRTVSEAAGTSPGGRTQPLTQGTWGPGGYQHPVWPSPAFRDQGKGKTKPSKASGSTAAGPAGKGAKGAKGTGEFVEL